MIELMLTSYKLANNNIERYSQFGRTNDCKEKGIVIEFTFQNSDFEIWEIELWLKYLLHVVHMTMCSNGPATEMKYLNEYNSKVLLVLLLLLLVIFI